MSIPGLKICPMAVFQLMLRSRRGLQGILVVVSSQNTLYPSRASTHPCSFMAWCLTGPTYQTSFQSPSVRPEGVSRARSGSIVRMVASRSGSMRKGTPCLYITFSLGMSSAQNLQGIPHAGSSPAVHRAHLQLKHFDLQRYWRRN